MGGSDKSRLMCCVVCVVEYLASKIRFVFHKVVWRHYSDEVSEFNFSDEKFPEDSIHQKLLTSIHFTPNYLKYTKGAV